MRSILRTLAAGVYALISPMLLHAEESLWLEAEHFEGIRGYCWPMGDPERPQMTTTHGNWGLSGPGWAAEWGTQTDRCA